MRITTLLLPAFLFIVRLHGQDSLAMQQYLQQHSWQVFPNNTASFHFDTAFYQQQLFLLGEVHGYQKAQELDLALFQHLHQTAGVKHYVAEIDAAQAWLLNEYLENGNEKLLDTIFNYWVEAGAQWGNKDHYRKWQKIYAWNKQLPAREKIMVTGIDKVQQLPLTLQYLQHLVQPTLLRQLPPVNNMLTAMQTTTTDSVRLYTLRQLDSAMQQNPAQYAAKAGQQLFMFNYLVKNLLAHYNKSSREQQFVNNFTAYYHHLNLQHHKIYGFLGFFHTIQDKVNNMYAFAGRLQASDLPLKNHIISLNIINMESNIMIDATINQVPFPPFVQLTYIPNQSGTRKYLKTDIVAQDGMLSKIKGCNMFKTITSPNSITVFDMQQASPILQHYNNFMDTEMPMPAGFGLTMNNPAGMHYQYLILIRHSDWAEPFLDK
ncbi:hypothetical protein SAMN05421788_111168 [Filimonas lacunae]|uniref:Erythromycin esterase n=1 Tax=Filimonas lacunae TaxID=477680 RepID=A0A173MAQ4_9BACT|nr:hypothetical protein [Filimonas lacunae]BAV04634.1 hypothetical protein FLA_0626 [Filimonas lacunae]SIT32566.1 hypothetical protein SAMN05421788_111168 [Filimonas lacunae]